MARTRPSRATLAQGGELAVGSNTEQPAGRRFAAGHDQVNDKQGGGCFGRAIGNGPCEAAYLSFGDRSILPDSSAVKVRFVLSRRQISWRKRNLKCRLHILGLVREMANGLYNHSSILASRDQKPVPRCAVNDEATCDLHRQNDVLALPCQDDPWMQKLAIRSQARVRVRLANILQSSPRPHASQVRESSPVPSTSHCAYRARIAPVLAKRVGHLAVSVDRAG
jgi:hypothetical protein